MSAYSEAIRLTEEFGRDLGTVALPDAIVRDAMRPGAMTCRADTPVRAVARAMVCHRMSAIAVTDLDGNGNALRRPRWDIDHLDVVKAAAEDRLDEQVGTIARRPAVSIDPGESLDVAMKRMVRYGAAHLVVVDADSNLPIGSLSASDVAGIIACESASSADT